MVKGKKKVKKVKKSEEKPSPFNFSRMLKFAIPVVVILVAFIGFKLRMQTAQARYFIDFDTFYHYEIYKLTIKEWIPSYYPMSDAPFGSKIGEPLGLYIFPALLYKMASLFGYNDLQVFRAFPPLVGFFSIIGIYLLGKKLHSEWAGLWSASIMMFSTSHFVRTFSGNNRGDGVFLMFFFYALISLFYYLDARRKGIKYTFGILSALFMTASLSSWNGSPFGLMVLLGFASINAIVLFIFGKIDELKAFVRDFYPVYALMLIIGYALTPSGIVRVGGHIKFASEVFVGLLLLTFIMLYGERFKLNYSDRAHRLGVVAVITFIGFAGAYLYVGPKLFSLMGGAYQSTQVYETVQELAKTTWTSVSQYYAVKSNDGIIFLISLAGILLTAFHLLKGLSKNNRVDTKALFVMIYYGMSIYLMWTAVRFLFLASGAIILTFGILVGELFKLVEGMQERVSTKALYAALLAILFIPIPIVGATTMNNQAKAMAINEPVTPSWEETLKWLREETPKLSTATSWWDYGYWIESSLLGNRRASADGGHARDRDYILARFLANTGQKSEVDFESWELNYFITWSQDIFKFNAISYLGGVISREERDRIAMFVPFQRVAENVYMIDQYRQIKIVTEEGRKRVVMSIGTQEGEPMESVIVENGEIIQGKGDFPGVVWIFPNYAIYAYHKIAYSNFFRMAFLSGNALPNFRLVKSTGDINVYEFRPFVLVRVEVFENNTWSSIKKLTPGEYKARLYISAFGRDVKGATLKLRAYNGENMVKEEVLAQNVNVDHLNEQPIEVMLHVPEAERYEIVLVQEGPVGVLKDVPRVNGEISNPIYVLREGESGNIELKAEFDRNYTVGLYLRATVIYLVRTQGTSNEDKKAVFEPHMDIIKYVPVKERINVKAGENVISANASMPEVFNSYIEKLKKEYGEDRLVIRGKRIEPVFITQKEYVIYGQS